MQNARLAALVALVSPVMRRHRKRKGLELAIKRAWVYAQFVSRALTVAVVAFKRRLGSTAVPPSPS